MTQSMIFTRAIAWEEILGPKAIDESYTLVALVNLCYILLLLLLTPSFSFSFSLSTHFLSASIFLENWPFRIKAIMLFLPCTLWYFITIFLNTTESSSEVLLRLSAGCGNFAALSDSRQHGDHADERSHTTSPRQGSAQPSSRGRRGCLGPLAPGGIRR